MTPDAALCTVCGQQPASRWGGRRWSQCRVCFSRGLRYGRRRGPAAPDDLLGPPPAPQCGLGRPCQGWTLDQLRAAAATAGGCPCPQAQTALTTTGTGGAA